jgi:hypothetical protein
VFTFGWEAGRGSPDIAPGSTRVEVTLTPDAGDTILTLRHSGLPPALVDQHHAGWSRCLPSLADATEPGPRS